MYFVRRVTATLPWVSCWTVIDAAERFPTIPARRWGGRAFVRERHFDAVGEPRER